MVNHAAGLEPPPRKGSSRFLTESLQNPSKGGPKKKEGDLFALVFIGTRLPLAPELGLVYRIWNPAQGKPQRRKVLSQASRALMSHRQETIFGAKLYSRWYKYSCWYECSLCGMNSRKIIFVFSCRNAARPVGADTLESRACPRCLADIFHLAAWRDRS